MFSSSHICRREDFFRFLDLEIRRARRYQNFFSVMRFELHTEEGGETRNQTRNVRSLVRLLREEIRETDVIGQTWDDEIMIILPYCDCPGANIVKMRLNGLISDFHFGDDGFKIQSGLVCFPAQGTDMADILDKLEVRNISGTSRGENKSQAFNLQH